MEVLVTNLKLAMGTFSYHGQGGNQETLDAFGSARALAERHGDIPGQLRAILVRAPAVENSNCGNLNRDKSLRPPR